MAGRATARLCTMSALLAAQAAAQETEHRTIELYRGTPPARYKIATLGPTTVPSPGYALRAAKVLPVTHHPIDDGTVLIRDGKIVAIGRTRDVKVPDGFERKDLGDAWLVPGFVDLHCHVGSASSDINDTVHQTNPEFRTLDLVTMGHERLQLAVAGGVTCVNYIPGSGSNMGGFGTLTKTAGRSPVEALVRFPGCLKVAQAGNPERQSGDLGSGRMGMNQGIRATLQRGQRYHQIWEEFEAGRRKDKPEFRADLHYLRGLFLYEYPIGVHTQRYQVVAETLRELRREFGLWTVVIHGEWEGYRLSGELLKSGLPVAAGPRQYDVDHELGRILGIHAQYYFGGDHGWVAPVPGLGRDGIGINTDSPVVPQEELFLQASMAARLGLPPDVALRGLTINPARFFGIAERVGSLEPGKDADLVAWTGDPIDPRSFVRMTIVNGNIWYDVEKDGRRF
jgi:imidazolonepropionase-like amidohydrolase